MVGQTKKLVVMMAAMLSVLILARVITISPLIVDRVVGCCTYPLLVAQRWVVTPLQQAALRRKTVDELTTIVHEYQKLLEEIRAENIELQATQEELQQTAPLRMFANRYKTDHMVLAQVMLRQCSHDGQFFLVDAGSNRGITLDMIVVYQNCLVGRVVEVYPWYAKVALITDSSSKVPVIATATQTQGIHEGCNSLEGSQLAFVSHLQPLQVGDLLISSGDGLIYPKGFAVGKIKEFTLDSLGLTYVVGVEPLIALRDITHCYVVAKGAEYSAAPAA